MIYDNGDDGRLFAGPACHILEGNIITIAVYKDEDCQESALGQNVDSYIFDSDGLQMNVSYTRLRSTIGRPLSCFVEAPMLTTAFGSNGNVTLEINDMCRSLKAEAFSCKDSTWGDGYSDLASTEDPATYQWMKAYCPPGGSTVFADDTENTVEETEDAEDAATSESDKGQQQQEEDVTTETVSTEGNLAENNSSNAPALSAAISAEINSLWVGSVLGMISAALMCY